MPSGPVLVWAAGAAVLGGGAGYVLTRWVERLVSVRLGQEPAEYEPTIARWINPRVVTIGTAGAATVASLVAAPDLVKVTMILAAMIAWPLICADAAIHKLPNPLVACAAAILVIGLSLQGLIDAGGLASAEHGEVEPTLPLVRAAVCAAGGFAAFAVLHALKPAALGRGDIKLAGVCGFALGWFGWNAPLIALWAAFIGAGVFAVTLMLARRATPSTMIAFGPWMIFGTAMAIAVS